jgi:hypothetical protein
LRRCTRRYSSQRDEFYHTKQVQASALRWSVDARRSCGGLDRSEREPLQTMK